MLNNPRIFKTILLALLLIPLILKAIHVDNFVYYFTQARFLGATQSIANDAIIYTSIFVLFYLSFIKVLPKLLAFTFRILAFTVFAVYLLDYWVITNFNTHLVITDVQKYAPYSLKYIEQILDNQAKFVFLLVLAVLLISFASLIVFTRYRINHKRVHKSHILLILSLMITASFADSGHYLHSWIYKNVISYNLTILSESKNYSDEFIESFSLNEQANCYSKAPANPNIILLMVESLSSYQSKYFSGLNDWTPNIDKIASKNTSYSNFYANGFTTEDGEISLLSGQFPIYPPSNYSDAGGTSFIGFFDIEKSLPRILKKSGYATEFLTSADLEFANTKAWAKNMGFDYIEGHDHPYYSNWDRFHFKAAPDEALYDRILDRVDENSENNYFLFIKTVSTHHPFINPENGNQSESETFQYADKQIGDFYKKLTEHGFFENGLLIIVGDHRAMVPIKEGEIEKFGSLKAAARVPMIVSYGDTNNVNVTGQYQQTDVFNSLQSLSLNKHCNSHWVGDILSNGKYTADYIVHRRGDNRDIISVFSGENDFLIKLDGDETRLIKSDVIERGTQEKLVNKVNSARIKQKKIVTSNDSHFSES
jgi:lipoteichoic acid synthase